MRKFAPALAEAASGRRAEAFPTGLPCPRGQIFCSVWVELWESSRLSEFHPRSPDSGQTKMDENIIWFSTKGLLYAETVSSNRSV